MTTRFTQLVTTTHDLINEEEPPVPGGADPGAAVGAPAEAMPPEEPAVAPPAPEPKANPGTQAIEDLTIAGKIALQIDDLTPEDRSMLIEPVNGENVANVRDLLSSIAAKYDIPN